VPQVITMNRPNEKNALTDELSIGLRIAIERVKQSPSLRVVFLTGAGTMFCAGGDPKAFQVRGGDVPVAYPA
jgi:enoyl-CoA hydratase/carnithine racemase